MFESHTAILISLAMVGCAGTTRPAPAPLTPPVEAAAEVVPCSEAAAAFGAVWGASEREQVQASYERAPLPSAESFADLAGRTLDANIAGWTAEYETACNSGDRKLAEVCLRRRARVLEETVAWLEAGATPQRLVRATETLAQLPRYLSCDDEAGVDREPLDQAAIAYVSGALDELVPENLNLLAMAAGEAAPMAYDAFSLSAAVGAEKKSPGAALTMMSAAEVAHKRGDRLAMGLAWGRTIEMGLHLGLFDHQVVEKVLGDALGAPEASVADRARLMLSIGRMAAHRKDVELSLKMLEFAVTVEPTSAEGRIDRVRATVEAVEVRASTGKAPKGAEQAYARALETLGPMHPITLEVARRLAAVFAEAGDDERAARFGKIAYQGTGVEPYDQVDRLEAVRLHTTALRRLGRVAEIYVDLDQVLAETSAPLFAIVVRTIIATNLAIDERFADSLALTEESVRLASADPQIAALVGSWLQHDLGDAQRGLGNIAVAAQHYEQSLAGVRADDLDREAHLHRDLAYTLISVPGRRGDALSHATRALAIYQQLDQPEAVRAVQAWIANPGPRGVNDTGHDP